MATKKRYIYIHKMYLKNQYIFKQHTSQS